MQHSRCARRFGREKKEKLNLNKAKQYQLVNNFKKIILNNYFSLGFSKTTNLLTLLMLPKAC